MPSYNYLSFIKNLLSNREMLSTEITDFLTKQFGITKNYGRKLIHKFVKNREIYSSYPLVFKGGQAGYSLKPGNNQYLCFLDQKPRLKSAYNHFIKDGFISKYKLLKISGVLNKDNTKYYDLGKLLADLKYFFPYMEEKELNDEIFYHNSLSSEEFHKLYFEKLESRKFEVSFLPLILDYANRINLIYKKPHYISKEMPFTGINIRQNIWFDATAFTGIGNANYEKSVVVFDVKINGVYSSEDFNGFKYRVDTLINSTIKYKQRVIPVIVSNSIEKNIFEEIYSQNKYMVLVLSNIFGSRFNDFIRILELKEINTLSEVKKILDIVENTGYAEQLTRFFPFIFESLVAEILNKIFTHLGIKYEIHRNKIVKYNKNNKEYDIWFENDQEILIVECKSYSSKINWERRDTNRKLKSDCCKYFYETKYDFLIDKGINKPIKMLMIASNGYSKAARANIGSLDKKLEHSYLPLSLSGLEIIDFCKNHSIGIKEQKEWLKKYYIKENLLESTDIEEIDIETELLEIIDTN